MKFKIEHSLDIRRTVRALSLPTVSHAFRNIKAGETMEILLCDPQIREYILKVLPARVCELIEIMENETCCRIVVRKKQEEA